jgi:hypothetical protein
MSATNALNTAIFSRLAGGTALTSVLGGTAIFYQMAKDNQTRPYVVFSYQTGNEENLTPSRMKNEIVYIRGYSNNQAQAGTIDTLIDSLIHGYQFTVTGYENFWTARETEVSLVEILPDNTKVYHAGAFYRLRISKT